MKGVEYKVILRGLSTPEGTIALATLVNVSETLLDGALKTLRLLVEGISVKRGKISNTLRKPLDLTITGISKGSTVLGMQAPTLKESAPELAQQLSFWNGPMKPEDTVMTLLSRSVQDATDGKVESEYYDRGVLESLLSFRSVLRSHITGFEIGCSSRPSEEFIISDRELDRISQIEAEIPEPKSIVVSGTFNSIEHTPRRFELVLQDGHKIGGIAESGYIDTEQMRHLWGKKVTIKGIAHFRPDGVVRLIEAEAVKPFEEGEELFETISKSRLPPHLIRNIRDKQIAESPLKEVWGKWPGDESIEEILDTLKQMSEEAV